MPPDEHVGLRSPVCVFLPVSEVQIHAVRVDLNGQGMLDGTGDWSDAADTLDKVDFDLVTALIGDTALNNFVRWVGLLQAVSCDNGNTTVTVKYLEELPSPLPISELKLFKSGAPLNDPAANVPVVCKSLATVNEFLSRHEIAADDDNRLSFNASVRNQTSSNILGSRALNTSSGILLSILWGFFAYAHLLAFKAAGDITVLLFVIVETLAASFYLFRSHPKSVSVLPFDWLVAVAGTFAPFLFRPTGSGVMPLASAAIIVGIILQMFALISLNRSFAIVAARRSIKTSKMYQVVRHPIYFSYCITFTGYVLVNTSFWNLAIYAMVIILLLLRIFREERHLSEDPSYRDYMSQVRYRLIPFIF